MRGQVFFCLVVQFLLAISIHGTPPKVSNTSEVIDDSARGLKDDDSLQVCVTEGCLRGKFERGNKEFYQAFYGIPYATPPVGVLRFKNPVEPKRYKETTRDATFPRDKCMQTDYVTNNIEGSEDCLYLNVYVPNKKSTHFLPVLVFIHGGAFKMGEASPKLLGPDFFMDTEQVIVVTLNYRLGVFGFLSSGDDTVRGNMGLKDQNMALQWIKINIVNFGGDPERVTLWGDSAGAASAHYHMMSAKSNGLFNKVIMAGGNAFAFWALERNPQKQFRQFAAVAGMKSPTTRDTLDLMKEIKKISAKDLQKFASRMYTFHPITPIFRPVIEGSNTDAIITEDPKTAWARGAFQKRPIFFLIATYEQGTSGDVAFGSLMKRRLQNDLDNSLIDFGEVTHKEIAAIKSFYLNGALTEQNINNVTLFRRDRAFFFPSYDMLEKYLPHQNAQNPLDMMMFSFTTTFTTTQLYHPFTQVSNGPSKMDYLLYLFRYKALDSYFLRGPAENSAKELMIRMWMKFITTGIERSTVYPLCTAQQIVPGSFCKYLLVNRKDNAAELLISDVFQRDDTIMRLLNSV